MCTAIQELLYQRSRLLVSLSKIVPCTAADGESEPFDLEEVFDSEPRSSQWAFP